ncbi:hypothetical protein SVAN01_10390 [Stagonosporopsis vannaccii]|nr:hypothetical protein SVAN01_10390 [Stagonosporopsis vannaccii]
MSSQYTRLPVPAAEEPYHSPTRDANNEYELGSILNQGPERHKPFAPKPSAPSVNRHWAEDYSYAPYQSDGPSSYSPVSSIAQPTSQTLKTAAVSVKSLTSQQHHAEPPDSFSAKAGLRTTLLSWGFELLAITVSLGALLAIILVLRREEGKPLTAWTLAITLNTVIATLGTLARTTLAFALSACVGQQKWNWLSIRSDQLVAWERFDEASRGPWGATRLFIWLRARHWAALGALVIIGTVAFDPFLQAVLTTKGQLDVDLQAQALIPQALVIDAGTIAELSTSGARLVPTSAGALSITGGMSAQPDFGMISAIYNGFRNDTSWYQDEQVVSRVCTSGNCTWSPFTSAAVCSACNDISAKMSVDQRVGNGGGNVPSPSNQVELGLYTAFILPYGNLSNSDIAKYKTPTSGRRMGTEATLLTANTTFDALETTSFQHLQTMIMSFIVIRASEEWIQGKDSWNVSKPLATECALYLCVNEYQAQVRDGKLKETILSSWALKDQESYQASPNSSNFKPGPEADAYVASKGDRLYDWEIQRTDLQLLIPREELGNSNPRTFNVSYAFITTLSDFLKDLTAGTKNIKQMAYPTWDEGMTPLVNVFWESQNLTETFDHVARSLTNQVRKTATDASHIRQVHGTTQKWEIHVRVQWEYLAFPAAMIVLGMVYVLLAIVESTRLHNPAWKESALPSLLHGLDDETQHLLRDAQLQQVGRRPNETIVKFEYDEKGNCLRLVAERDVVR